MQHQSDQQHAQDQHKSDQQRALDQQRATTLQTYIDNMRDLLLNHNLAKSAPGNEVRQVARVQTLNTLRNLDADRNMIVLRFLQDARLIGIPDAAINLSNGDLRNDYLSGANLDGIDLAGAILTGAHLEGAHLSGAYLYGTNLSNAHMDGAYVNDAYLFDAVLTSANLNGAHLSNATLTSAILDHANVKGATLTGARLDGAILTDAHLNSSALSGASLYRADLSGADLSGANLNYDDLRQSITQHQLDKVSSCTNATLDSGLICHDNAEITLTYMYAESTTRGRVIDKLVRQFEQKNHNIKINVVNKSYLNTPGAFTAVAQADKAPDVFLSDIGWVSQLASQGYLLSIDSFTHQSDMPDYINVPLRYNYYNGNLYGLPQVTDVLALLYNKAELKKAGIDSPPATMADFERDAEKVAHDKTATYGFETNGQGYYTLPFLYAFGGGMFDQHNNISVNSKQSVDGLKFLLKLKNSDKAMPNINYSNWQGQPVDDFKNGRAAMIIAGPWNISAIWAGSAFAGNKDNLGIAAIPTGPAGKTGSPLGGESYVISNDTKHPFEAYKFISFMSSTSSQIAIAKANHTLPTRQSAYRAGLSSDPVIKDFFSAMRTAIPRPAMPQTAHLFDVFDPNIARALNGVQSPTAALNAIANAWKQLLAGS